MASQWARLVYPRVYVEAQQQMVSELKRPMFLKEFGAKVAELQLTHYFNRPNYPQRNGRIQRSFRTDEEEFYQVEDLPAGLGGLGQALLA